MISGILKPQKREMQAVSEKQRVTDCPANRDALREHVRQR